MVQSEGTYLAYLGKVPSLLRLGTWLITYARYLASSVPRTLRSPGLLMEGT